SEVEPELRRDWQRRHGDKPWDRVAEGIRDAWESATGTGERAVGAAESRPRTRAFDAEPNYRYGWDAGRNSRWANRGFDEVEAELRRGWETERVGSGKTWDDLREEIREGWDRARGI